MTRRILAAPDKYRGTATAAQLCDVVARVAASRFWAFDLAPMADGGEGTLDVISGAARKRTTVTGPLGDPVEAEWVMKGSLAVIEMAQACGYAAIGGVGNNRPLDATTKGAGELIAAAIKSGADEIIVGVGGSVTTDGGLACIKELWPQTRLREIDITVVADVETRFVDAARVFGPQKGASPAEVALLEGRLQRLAAEYEKDFGIDVTQIPGSGAAGGIAGGLAAVGAKIVLGYEYLADLVHLDERIEQADIVITGEGKLDTSSTEGKVVGGVVHMARRASVPVIVVCGDVERDAVAGLGAGVTVISLTERFGRERSMADATGCFDIVVQDILDGIDAA